jgi:hypothetical protein
MAWLPVSGRVDGLLNIALDYGGWWSLLPLATVLGAYHSTTAWMEAKKRHVFESLQT